MINLLKLPNKMITALKTATNKAEGILIDSQNVKKMILELSPIQKEILEILKAKPEQIMATM